MSLPKSDFSRFIYSIIVVSVTAFLVLASIGFYNTMHNDKESAGILASVGDSFGIITCVASLVTVILVYSAFNLQKTELRDTRLALEKANDTYDAQLRNNERNNLFNEFKSLCATLEGNLNTGYVDYKTLSSILNGDKNEIDVTGYGASITHFRRDDERIDFVNQRLLAEPIFIAEYYKLIALICMIEEYGIDNESGFLTTSDKVKLYNYLNISVPYEYSVFTRTLLSHNIHCGGGYCDPESVKKAFSYWSNHSTYKELRDVLERKD
jgi:hypothetical protein